MKKELVIMSAVGFCKNCFRSRRQGSAYCGECRDEASRMKIYKDDRNEFPLLDKVVERFELTLKDLENVIFTYGDTLYSDRDLSLGLQAHELTHVFQQLKMGVKEWWEKYLSDDEFRLSQELEAYQRQYQVLKEKNVVTAKMDATRTAGDLSSKMYGGIIEFEEARMLIMGADTAGLRRIITAVDEAIV